MTASTTEAPVDERPATALRLLLGAEIALLCWSLFSDQLRHLSRLVIEDAERQPSQAFETLQLLPDVVLSGLVVLGLLRFVAPLGDGGARRWGYAAAVLSGLTAVWYLCFGVLPLVGVEINRLHSSVFAAASFVTVGSKAALLVTLWKSAPVLAIRPPKGVLGFALGAAALLLVIRLVKRLVWNPSWHDEEQLVVAMTGVMSLLMVSLEILIAGALGVMYAARRSLRDTTAGGSQWASAADGLGLYNTWLYARIAAHIIALALPRYLESQGAGFRTTDTVQGLIMLVGLGFGGMMLVGLLRYASLPEQGSARGYVYACLVLLTLADSLALTLHSRMPWSFMVLPASFVLLAGSLHKVAQVLKEQELAEAARKAAFWIFVPSSVVAVLRGLGIPASDSGLFSIAAVICVLVGVGRFFRVMGQLRKRMPHGATPPAPIAQPIFSSH